MAFNVKELPVSVRGVCRDVRDFLRGLSQDLPEVFPQPRVYYRRVRRRRPALPRPSREDVARARALITARTQYWAERLGVTYKRIAIKSQRSLWGSCSRAGNLNFNWRLAAAPAETLDYVVIHELCHLREMNHSSRFWAHVGAACPGYREQRRWLRKNSMELMGVRALAVEEPCPTSAN
jgi:predicted metal-dependent hydrolase